MIYFANGTVMIDFSSNKTNRSFTIDKIVTILAKSLKTIVQTKIDFLIWLQQVKLSKYLLY